MSTTRLIYTTMASVALLGYAVGCGCNQGMMDMAAACSEVSITATDANNEYDSLSADQCEVSLSNGVLEIDIIDNSSSAAIIPRVLLTIDVPDNAIPESGEFDLSRADNEALPPALYQDWVVDTDPAEGNLWSALMEEGGQISFEVQGLDVVATFEFTGENANPDTEAGPNNAEGMLTVSGSLVVGMIPDEMVDGCGACGSGSMASMMILAGGLLFMRRRLHRD